MKNTYKQTEISLIITQHSTKSFDYDRLIQKKNSKRKIDFLLQKKYINKLDDWQFALVLLPFHITVQSRNQQHPDLHLQLVVQFSVETKRNHETMKQSSDN